MTVAELRKALEGLPSDMLVVHDREGFDVLSEEAKPVEARTRDIIYMEGTDITSERLIVFKIS